MAVAAEVYTEQTHEFDWYAAEKQFEPPTNYERPPEAEIYGRSLSTIQRLGSFMIGKVAPEIINSHEADQVKAEFYTSVEEGFGTDLELGGGLEVRDFASHPVIEGRVMAKDLKTPISDMTAAGLICAEEKVRAEAIVNDERFLPQLTRSKRDHENALCVDKMARGETSYNTRIVISPFPEEAAAESGDSYWRNIGYVPHLKRGFVQLYHSTNEGIVAGSLSFDGSNKERLREVFSRYGVQIPETEVTDNWLKYAVTDTLTEDQATALALEIADQAGDPIYKKTTNTVSVTNEHRSIMDTVFNESYVHACESLARGYQTAGARELIFQLADKAGSFNHRYADALYAMRANEHRFTDDDMVVLHELLVYSTIEMMRALHIQNKKQIDKGTYVNQQQYLDLDQLQAMNSEAFKQALSNFGAQGASMNRVYSACGLAISPGNSAEMNNRPQAAFGGFSFNSDEKGSLTFFCSNGHFNRRRVGKLLPACQRKGCKAKVAC